jgi:hypothetical protein
LEALFLADFLHEFMVRVLIAECRVGFAVLVPIVILSRETIVFPVWFNYLRLGPEGFAAFSIGAAYSPVP